VCKTSVGVLLTDSTVSRGSAAKSRRPMRGRKVTTGRLSRHDVGSRLSALPPRGKHANSRSGGRSSSRQQAAQNTELVYDDEWEADDAEKIPQENTNERCDRLMSTVPRHAMEHDRAQEQLNSGLLLCFIIIASCH